MIRRLMRSPVAWLAAAVLVVAAVAGLYSFQPWKLFTNKTVNEPLPSAEASPGATPAEGRNVVLATGALVSLEHDTSGTARLIRLADGSVQLVFEGLSTSDGPDLRVWLTDQPVVANQWRVFDDGRYVEVGRLKGNRGNQVYPVPPGTDLNGLRSVAIWCKRFSVGFGAAELH
jgi:hypothetical protein